MSWSMCQRSVREVHPGSVYYEEVDPEKVEAIVNEHIVGGVPTDKYMLKEETTDGNPAKTMTGNRLLY